MESHRKLAQLLEDLNDAAAEKNSKKSVEDLKKIREVLKKKESFVLFLTLFKEVALQVALGRAVAETESRDMDDIRRNKILDLVSHTFCHLLYLKKPE